LTRGPPSGYTTVPALPIGKKIPKMRCKSGHMQSIVLAGEWYAPRHDLDGAEERGGVGGKKVEKRN